MAGKKAKPPVGGSINYQARQIIYNVHAFLKERKSNPLFNVDSKQAINVLNLTAEATGVSRATVIRVISEGKRLKDSDGIVHFKPEDSKKHSRKKRIKIDETTEATIRRKVIQFYKTKKQVPSIRKLNALLKKEKILHCSNEFLRTLLYKLGFTNSDNNDDGLNLVEHLDTEKKRQCYLQAIRKHRELKTSIFFINEFKWWEAIEDMPDVIAIHISGSNGFLDQSKLMIFSKSDSQLKESSKNTVYDQWILNKFMPNVPKDSVIVINSPYVENTGPEKFPNTRSELETWLLKHNIEFEETAHKRHLHELVQENYEKYQCNLAKSLLHAKANLLFLPENHHDLNPVKLAWEEIREETSDVNATDIYKNISHKTWMSCFNKVCNNEREYGNENTDTAEDECHLMEVKHIKQELYEDDNCFYEISMECDH